MIIVFRHLCSVYLILKPWLSYWTSWKSTSHSFRTLSTDCLFTGSLPDWTFIFVDATSGLKSFTLLSNWISKWMLLLNFHRQLLKSGHRFSGLKLEHTKLFLGLSRHFSDMTTAALIVVIVGIIWDVPNVKQFFLKCASDGVSFIPVCLLVFV